MGCPVSEHIVQVRDQLLDLVVAHDQISPRAVTPLTDEAGLA
jgi:hypothetical protein